MASIVDPPSDHKTRVPHFSRAVGARSGDFDENTPSPVARDSSASEPARRERRRALIVPREHGAWGLLLVPMVTGAGIAFRESTNVFPFLLLFTATLVLFWLRTPLESLLGTSAMRAQTPEERRDVRFVVIYLATIATLVLAMLLWSGRNPVLWMIGSVAGAAFVTQALLKLLCRPPLARLMWRRPPRPSRDGEAERPRSTPPPASLRMLSEIVGTIGLTASAPAAYYVITGKFGLTAWTLWVANLIFAGDQIHYVQLRLHTARVEGLRAKLACGWGFAIGQFLLTAALTIACISGLIPKYASIAFAPVLFRGWYYFVQQPTPLVVRRLGWNELGQAVAFCVLFIASFSFAK